MSGAAAAPRTRKGEGRYHHGSLRAALVECGLRLLEARGPAGLSLRHAAAMAGVSPAAPAHHVGGKAGLLAAVAAEGFRRLDAAAREAAEASAGPEGGGGVLALVRSYLRFAERHTALFHLMFGPELPDKSAHTELAEAAERCFRRLDAAVRRHLEAAGRAHDPGATMAAWSLMHGLATLLVERQRAPPSAGAPAVALVVRRATEALLAGLVAQAPLLREDPAAPATAGPT